eukprot:TRINITY_DN10137_c0_g1_i1.p1 TRINITY_DN10137_c0_g1~~TRINITY_DN10137_c0_g1_i1.p1  ORF type:complete len:365 (+),score=74.26 TRINITY_DN10137_c0_g1_i1:32-1126(+)
MSCCGPNETCTETKENEQITQEVSTYYANLKSTNDLLTNACCVAESPPPYIATVINQIHEDVLNRFYGCGFPITEAVEGCRVLDLGCGTGRDVYIYSKLVGCLGSVVGLDMTDEQLQVARSVQEYQRGVFGYSDSNVSFVEGYIETLTDHVDGTFDVVVSNCVVNLSPDKKKVLEEVYSVLNEGGEFYFSDVFCDRRLDDNVKNDPILYGECLGGALYINDFISIAKNCGFADPRIVEMTADIELAPEVRKKVGNASFVSITYRLFKLKDLEDNCEDYGQIAIYKGTLDNHSSLFALDKKHFFEKGRPEKVCSNTALMLQGTRFNDHFTIIGDLSYHYGSFECGNTTASELYSMAGGISADGCC